MKEVFAMLGYKISLVALICNIAYTKFLNLIFNTLEVITN